MIPERSAEQPNLRRRLPLGATGFRDQKSEPLPETDPRTFAGVCHETAIRTGGRISKITSPKTTPSFHVATVSSGQDYLAILGHRHLPILAIADPPTANTGSVIFVDDLLLREALTLATPFYLAPLEELLTSLSLVDLSDLAASELKQIAFWKPQTIGELLFNYWA